MCRRAENGYALCHRTREAAHRLDGETAARILDDLT